METELNTNLVCPQCKSEMYEYPCNFKCIKCNYTYHKTFPVNMKETHAIKLLELENSRYARVITELEQQVHKANSDYHWSIQAGYGGTM